MSRGSSYPIPHWASQVAIAPVRGVAGQLIFEASQIAQRRCRVCFVQGHRSRTTDSRRRVHLGTDDPTVRTKKSGVWRIVGHRCAPRQHTQGGARKATQRRLKPVMSARKCLTSIVEQILFSSRRRKGESSPSQRQSRLLTRFWPLCVRLRGASLKPAVRPSPSPGCPNVFLCGQ